MRARTGLGAGFALALGICGCGGGPPDDVPFVRTGGGTATITKSIGGSITSGERLGNPASTPASQSGTAPAAGTGNDLTGAAGFDSRADSDFIGVDEISGFDDFQDVEDFANLNNFAAGFVVPTEDTTVIPGGAATTGNTPQTPTGTTTTTTTTTTTRRTTNAQ